MQPIIVRKLAQGDIGELLKLAYVLDEDAFKKAFASKGFTVSGENDINTLARLHLSGGDVAGEFKNQIGEMLVFNVENVLANLNSSESYLNHFHSKEIPLDFKSI